MSAVAIVTGGGRGIGAATARLLGQRGYDVAVSYVSNDKSAADVVRDVEAGGHRGLAVRADCGVESEILRLFEAVDRAGEEALGSNLVAAPWDPTPRLLGQHLLQMVGHINTHKAQLFYYLKLQGKPVTTYTMWGLPEPQPG